MSWRDALTKSIVVKESLALANTRDGGVIVFGVADGTFAPDGMTQSEFDSFDNDKVADHINRYAEPRIQTSVRKGTHDHKLFVIVDVQPCRVAPVVCARSGGVGSAAVRAGDIYIRPVGKPEARRVENFQEMNELIQRATVPSGRSSDNGASSTTPIVPRRIRVSDGSVIIHAGERNATATIVPVDRFNSDLTFSPTGNIRGRIATTTTVEFDRDDTTTDQEVWYRIIEHGGPARRTKSIAISGVTPPAKPLTLDLAVTSIGTPQAFRLSATDERPFGGGWLYVIDLRITNREAESVTLIPDLLVMTDPEYPEKGPRSTLHALEAPPREVDEELRRYRRVNGDIDQVEHLPAPITVVAKGTVRGYVSFQLPEIMIRHFPGGIDEQTQEMSEHPPDTARLRFRDDLTGCIHDIQPFDAFQIQRIEANMQRVAKANRERAKGGKPPLPPSAPDTSAGQP